MPGAAGCTKSKHAKSGKWSEGNRDDGSDPSRRTVSWRDGSSGRALGHGRVARQGARQREMGRGPGRSVAPRWGASRSGRA
eukprot:7376034-Prymnesium_polylepis.1